jgi:hypothetical protein
MYDRARFREEEGLPQKTRRFDAIARECCKALEQEIERGIRRETNKDYLRTINKYLVPFFGKFMPSNITTEKVRAYEQWRNEQMGRVPISSTLATHASAYSRALMASPNSPTHGHPKFPQAAPSDYDPSAWMAKRAAASLSL